MTCSEEGCKWTGTRPDKHLVSAHGFEKEAAKVATKQIKLSQCHKLGDKISLGQNMHTAESVSKQFFNWFETIEGGHYIPDYMESNKRSQKQKQNKKCQQNVQTIIKTCLGEGEFHASALSMLSTIGRPQKKGETSVIEKLQRD